MPYSRDIVILANSWKNVGGIHGHCIAGKDLETLEWIRVVNDFVLEGSDTPVPFMGDHLKEKYGSINGPELLDCVRISFNTKLPKYYQPENHQISDDEWESLGELDESTIDCLLDPYPDWLTNPDKYSMYDRNDIIHPFKCNRNKPLLSSLCFMKFSTVKNLVEFRNATKFGRLQSRISFTLEENEYDLSLTDCNYSKNITELEDVELSNIYLTIGVGNIFKGNHYKFVVGLIPS
jgi:hypothetical protein